MDKLEELAVILNETGVKLRNLKIDDQELIKKLFLWADLIKDCSETNESNIMPFKNYLGIRYEELARNNMK